jgi:hypothetical protein
MFTQFIRKRKQEVLDGMLKCGSIIPVIAASLFLAGCEIQIRGIPPWLGLIYLCSYGIDTGC